MSKTLTQLRKEIGLDTASEVRRIAQFFVTLAETNPEAVKAALPWFIRKGDDTKQEAMVEFYKDQAAYLIKLFTLD